MGPGGQVFSINDILGMQQQFMNPYQQQVIDATNANFDQSLNRAITQGAQQATAAGAFGGSRGQILQAVMGAQNEMNRNTAISGLQQQGFNQSMSNAFGFANQRNNVMNQMAANQRAATIGAADVMRGGVGPTSGSRTETTRQPGGGWGSVLGGIGTIALGALTGGAGPAAMAGLGLLGNMGNQAGNPIGAGIQAGGYSGSPFGGSGLGMNLGGLVAQQGPFNVGAYRGNSFLPNHMGGYDPSRWNLGG
jgi:hypothetical protein